MVNAMKVVDYIVKKYGGEVIGNFWLEFKSIGKLFTALFAFLKDWKRSATKHLLAT